MPLETFNATPTQQSGTPRADFSHRVQPHELPEWMDSPGTYEELRGCLRDLARVNRTTLGYRPTLRFLRRSLTAHTASGGRHPGQRSAETPLRIVDIGCGGGDTLREIERWGWRQRIPLQLTGVDLNPHAIRAAREFSPTQSAISWVVCDALSFTQPGGVDFVISSLLMHHLEETSIVELLVWMERVARRGWFLNDLRRTRTSFLLFQALARVANWHPFVRHDGPVSIRRSFQEEDWKRLLGKAEIPAQHCRVERYFPGRLCVGRLK